MRNLARKKIVLAVLVLVAILAASFKIYFIREDAGGYVLWNANEAYFFIGNDVRGLHIRWLGIPWFLFKNLIGGFAAVELPDDDRGSSIVVVVTSSGAKRYDFRQNDRRPGSGLSLITPINGKIYANWPELGGLCRWGGDHFELVTGEEERSLNGNDPNPIGRLTMKPLENENGWTRRGLEQKLTINVGDKFKLLLSNSTYGISGEGAISIDQQFPGRALARIFNLNVRNVRVSATEYRQVFYAAR